MDTNLTFRTITEGDRGRFPAMLELLNRTQGRGLFKEDYLERQLEARDTFVFGALRDDEPVALGVAKLVTDFCVSETHQGKGLGQEISSARLRWLCEKGCQTILGISWVSGLAHTSDRVFRRLGFREVSRLDRFFFDSSLRDPFVCPGCGGPPCTCSAILFRWDLDTSEH